MKFLALRMAVVLAVCVVIGLAHTRADNFQWNQSPGPPGPIGGAYCNPMPPCVTSTTCQNVNPPVFVVPDGKTNTVQVQSYLKATPFTYGTCAWGGSGTCTDYPNVRCAIVEIYSMPGCNSTYFLGNKTVYMGTCII
jgi:hypothetical protein